MNACLAQSHYHNSPPSADPFKVVACPANSAGTPPSCACDAGYSVTITPATAGYSGSCTSENTHRQGTHLWIVGMNGILLPFVLFARQPCHNLITQYTTHDDAQMNPATPAGLLLPSPLGLHTCANLQDLGLKFPQHDAPDPSK